MKEHAVGTNSISGFFYFPNPREHANLSIKHASSGIFLGYSLNYSMPFFLDFDDLINPHMFIVGMSGGGKTFLMKNLIMKFKASTNFSLVLVDLTGEYQELMDFLGVNENKTKELRTCLNEPAIVYFKLHGLKDKEKINAAVDILKEISEYMRERALDSERRLFVLLDEAWKLLKESRYLEEIIREGRKYKTGLVMASQLVEDIELPMLANSATLFIFRVQNKESLTRLTNNFGLDENDAVSVQNLGIGSCMVIQVLGSRRRSAFFIKKIIGVPVKKNVDIVFGGSMIEMNEEELGALIRRLCKKDPSALVSEISSTRRIDLNVLIKSLILLEADRREVLDSLRKLNIRDKELAEAFACAVQELGVNHA